VKVTERKPCAVRWVVKRNVAFLHKRRQRIGQKNGLSYTPSSPKQVQIYLLSITIWSLHILVKPVKQYFRKESSLDLARHVRPNQEGRLWKVLDRRQIKRASF